MCFVEIVDKETGDRLSKIVDEACLLLADYNGRLAAELEDRATISKMLAAFIQLQRDKLAESEKKLEVCCFVENRLKVLWPFSFWRIFYTTGFLSQNSSKIANFTNFTFCQIIMKWKHYLKLLLLKVLIWIATLQNFFYRLNSQNCIVCCYNYHYDRFFNLRSIEAICLISLIML